MKYYKHYVRFCFFMQSIDLSKRARGQNGVANFSLRFLAQDKSCYSKVKVYSSKLPNKLKEKSGEML